MRSLAGNQNIMLTSAPALSPPEVTIDPELLRKYEREIEESKNIPLPEDDEDL